MKTLKMRGKGAGEMDYIIAIGIFILIFGFSMSYLTSYFTTAKDSLRVMTLRSEADSAMRITDFGFYPGNWTNESYPDRVGLQSRAYRFSILANNTQVNLVDTSRAVADLVNERITFNYSRLGFSNIDYNSTVIYNETGGILDYSRSGDNITFTANISANSARWFTIYFDDDSNFTSRSISLGGSDNLTEKILAVEEISLMQFRNIQRLQDSNYTIMKNSTGLSYGLNVSLTDTGTGAAVLAFGEIPVNETNIVSLQRFIIYQNSSAAIKKGRIIVRVW